MLDYGKIFQLPLSMVASYQLAELVDSLEEWNREPNDHDNWTYIWGLGIFTSKQDYENMKVILLHLIHSSGYGNLYVKENIR
jgi:hypothetical protein